MKTHYTVFISYSSHNASEAYNTKAILEKNNISCWMAPDSIPVGSSYAKEIPKAIQNCKVFILILSEIAQKSKWIPKELDHAIINSKLLIPVIIEDCQLDDQFAFYLSNVQCYETWRNQQLVYDRIIQAIHQVSDESGRSTSKKGHANKKSHSKVKTSSGTITRVNSKRKSISLPPILTLLSVIAATVIILFLLFWLFPVLIGHERAAQSSIIFEDTALHNAVCNELHLLNGRIKKSDIEDVKELDLSFDENREKISNISGLSAFSNLETLNLAGNSITDISEIKDMVSLKAINLEMNQISDISPLADLIYLESIDLNDNKNISDVSHLKNLEKVTMLDLRSNHIQDISGISHMVNLKQLYLSYNQITDLSPLIRLQNLTYLSFDYNQVKDIRPLSALTGLHTLTMNGNRIEDIHALVTLQELVHLEIAGNHIKDRSPLDLLPENIEIEDSETYKK